MVEIAVSLVGYTALVSVALWLGRTWLKERLTASIRLDTEKKLAALKSELEATNQRMQDVTSAGTAANAQVESALLDHRIGAVKTVWESVLGWQSMSVITMMASVLDEQWLEKNASDPGTRSTFEQLLKNVDSAGFMKKHTETEFVRPFLSEPIWASYQAYSSFLSARLTKAWLLATPGLAHADMLSRLNERDLVEKSATAEILAIYDSSPYAGTEPYLRFLREKMLTQFRELLSGQRAGQQAVQEAAQILRSAEVTLATSQKMMEDQIEVR